MEEEPKEHELETLHRKILTENQDVPSHFKNKDVKITDFSAAERLERQLG